MECSGKHRLVAHRHYRPKSVRSVEVQLSRNHGGYLFLSYAVEPAGTLVLPQHGIERRDDLWHNTCFELFLRGEGGGYQEFNFAPIAAWNAYAFTDWRKGMKPLQVSAKPHLVDSRLDDRRHLFPASYELDVVLGPEFFSAAAVKLSLAAIIEEMDGTKSYWALAHPPGDPNFHHPACFTVEVAPAGAT